MHYFPFYVKLLGSFFFAYNTTNCLYAGFQKLPKECIFMVLTYLLIPFLLALPHPSLLLTLFPHTFYSVLIFSQYANALQTI